tara:strand:+ start:5532 stop:6065 length:534 start_codon:yes stop_codon:yes gene_type:complete
MNKSNIYTYTILSIVWYDLSHDLLTEIKKYLDIHLKKRKLNQDYKKFLKIAYQKKLECKNSDLIFMLTTRFNLDHGYKDINEIDKDMYFPYYICGHSLDVVEIPISVKGLCLQDRYNRKNTNHFGVTDDLRTEFVESYKSRHFSWGDMEEACIDLIQDKHFIRNLMDKEENSINDNY